MVTRIRNVLQVHYITHILNVLSSDKKGIYDYNFLFNNLQPLLVDGPTICPVLISMVSAIRFICL